MPKTFHNLKGVLHSRYNVDASGRPVPDSLQEKVILYNETQVTQEELQQMIRDDSFAFSDRLLVLDKDQAESLVDKEMGTEASTQNAYVSSSLKQMVRSGISLT